MSSRICAPCGRRSTREENPLELHHQRRARADFPGAGMGRDVRAVSRLRLDASGSTDQRDSGSASTKSPIICSGACASRSSRRCCIWCAIACAPALAQPTAREAHLDRLLQLADPVNPNVLTIGFARRFATYKRATLLFEDLDWLRADRVRRSSARCCSCSPARRIRPTSPARI